MTLIFQPFIHQTLSLYVNLKFLGKIQNIGKNSSNFMLASTKHKHSQPP